MAPSRRSPSNDIGDVIDHVLVTDSRPSSWLEHRRAATPTPPSGPGRAAGQLIISVLRHFRCYISSVLHQSLQPQPPPPLPSSRDRHSHTNPQADSQPTVYEIREECIQVCRSSACTLRNGNTAKTMKNVFFFLKLRALT